MHAQSTSYDTWIWHFGTSTQQMLPIGHCWPHLRQNWEATVLLAIGSGLKNICNHLTNLMLQARLNLDDVETARKCRLQCGTETTRLRHPHGGGRADISACTAVRSKRQGSQGSPHWITISSQLQNQHVLWRAPIPMERQALLASWCKGFSKAELWARHSIVGNEVPLRPPLLKIALLNF